MGDAVAVAAGERDRVVAADHEVPRVEAEGHGGGLEQALDVRRLLDQRVRVGVDGEREAVAADGLLEALHVRRQRVPLGVGERPRG